MKHDYTSYSYEFPPRPELAVLVPNLSFYERRGYIAQVKKHGVCNVMDIDPDRNIIAMNRHRKEHVYWRPDAITQMPFLKLAGGWYKFVTELLDRKVVGQRHINYINDILVADSERLIGTTFAERQALLRRLFPDAVIDISGNHYVIDSHTWLARNHTEGGLLALFNNVCHPDNLRIHPEDEGLVLKNPKALLMLGIREASNSSWQRKLRRETTSKAF
jgi:hypothetical protein